MMVTDRHWWETRATACREAARTTPSESVRTRMLGFAMRYDELAATTAEDSNQKAVSPADAFPIPHRLALNGRPHAQPDLNRAGAALHPKRQADQAASLA